MKQIAVDVCLGLAVAVAALSSIGVLVMREVYQKLHYVTPVALVAPLFVGLAVLLESGWSNSSAQTWLALLLVAIGSPFLSHATIRAARIRETGSWRVTPDREGGQAGERP